MKKHILRLITGITILFLSTMVSAQSPRSFNYQGVLLDNAQKPVTGVHHLTITLYDAALEGTALHTENFTSQVEDGIFSVVLGSQSEFESTLTFDVPYWIGVSVDGGAEL